MKYGKIRIEDGNFIFSKHMMMNYLPCKDILWAYKRKEGVEGGVQKQYSTSSLVIITRRRKKYQFEMTDREIQNCIQLLRALNPEIVTGFPHGSRIPLQSLPNTRDLGAIQTEDGRHILPKRLLRSGNLYHISITDQDTLLNEYHLSTVIDFRTRMECLERPDTIIEGVQYHDMPIVDEEILGITRSGTPTELLEAFREAPEDFMLKQYESLVHDDYSVKQYARFLDVLLQHIRRIHLESNPFYHESHFLLPQVLRQWIHHISIYTNHTRFFLINTLSYTPGMPLPAHPIYYEITQLQ